MKAPRVSFVPATQQIQKVNWKQDTLVCIYPPCLRGYFRVTEMACLTPKWQAYLEPQIKPKSMNCLKHALS